MIRGKSNGELVFEDQAAFVEWIFEEPHAGFHVLSLAPRPAGEQDPPPEVVSMRWGAPDPAAEDDRFFVWRVRFDGVTRYRMQGSWVPGYGGDAHACESEAPVFIQLSVPGALILEGARVIVEEEGWVVEEVDRFTWSHHLSWNAADRSTTVADLLRHLGLPIDTSVLSYSGVVAAAEDLIVALPKKSARAWRIGADGDSELMALIVQRSGEGYSATCERRDAVSDALWDLAYRLPNVLPGVGTVRSGNVDVFVEDWHRKAAEGLAPSPLVFPGGGDPSSFAHALEPGPVLI